MDFIDREIKFTGSIEESAGNEQKNIFIVFNSLSVLVFSVILIISLLALIQYIKDTNNGYSFLKANTYLAIIPFFLTMTLVAMQPGKSTKESTLENGFVLETILEPAKYIYGWLIILFSITIFFFSGLTRREYGYVTKDIFLTKWKTAKNKNPFLK
ncbi:hypothetical protein ACW95P_03445 [Candidatus Mycoplasma pogonae]